MGDIVQFPKEKQETSPQSLEQTIDQINEYKLIHAHECTEMMAKLVFHHLDLMGFTSLNITDEEVQKNEALIIEAIRSYMLMNHGVAHPFQRLSSKIFKSSNNNIHLDDSLSIVFKTRKPNDTKKAKSEA
jgi:hypothetical protein